MAGVKIHFQVGSLKNTRSSYYTDAMNQFTDVIEQKVILRASAVQAVHVPKLRAELNRRIKKSLNRAVTFAATTLVGTKSNIPESAAHGRLGAPTFIQFNWNDPDLPVVNPKDENFNVEATHIFWEALARSTRQEKAKTMGWENARRFFVHTGALQRNLLKLAQDITDKTGTVLVEYKSDDTVEKFSKLRGRAAKVKIGQLRLRYLPNLQTRYLPGLRNNSAEIFDANMKLEESLGLSELSINKLKGVHDRHRPLLQPVLTYWILNRLPKVTAVAIRDSITKDYK